MTIGWSDGASEREARVEVIRAAWRSAYRHIFSTTEIDGIFDGSLVGQGSWVAARVAPAGTLAARERGRLVGLASLGLLGGNGAELAAFYVHPDRQGRGIGLALWARALDELGRRGCRRMEVWTLARSAARGFYEARGCTLFREGSFAVAGHREPAVAYELDLPGPPMTGSSQSMPER